MAESKFQTDGAENDEIKIYDEVQDYLVNGSYSQSATKVDKGVKKKKERKSFYLLTVSSTSRV